MFHLKVVSDNLLSVNLFLMELLQELVIPLDELDMAGSLALFKLDLIVLESFHDALIEDLLLIDLLPEHVDLLSGLIHLEVRHVHGSEDVWLLRLSVGKRGLHTLDFGL